MKLRIALSSLVLSAAAFGASTTPHLLQKPTMNKTTIVFTYAGDLWSVARAGGIAIRLTTATGVETDAIFSPDGQTIAFTGEYDGNVDVFTVPAAGGVPKRITHHPDADRLVGWTVDGKRLLFRSGRESASRYTQLFTVPVEGGLPEVLPLPMACTGAYSPDGKRMLYAPLDGGQFAPGFANFVAWKRYRGGQASYLWLVNFADLSTVRVPRADSNDINPMWIGNMTYFLSDRDNGVMTLFSYDPQSKAVKKLIINTGRDIRWATSGPGGIVYEQFGEIHIFDTATGKSNHVKIDITADLTEVRPRIQNVAREIRSARISPTGVRAVFEAHGEVLSVPAEKGDIRNLTRTPGVMERTPTWSPDGKSIAYFSDESGEYALHIKPQSGSGETKKIPLAGNAAYYFNPQWSPDSKHFAMNDNQLNIWNLEIATGKLTKVDVDYFHDVQRDFSWSADSKWITFSKYLPNRLHAVFVYSLETGKSTQITDGLSDARNPVFDRDGQYLYFSASTNFGPTSSGLDMTSDEHEVTRSIYLAVLPNDLASPLAPESDEEKPGEPRPAATGDGPGRGRGGAPAPEAPPKPVRIDLDKIQQRIVALPLPARGYAGLETGRAGILYVLEAAGGGRGGFGAGLTLSKFDLKTRKTEKLADNVAGWDLSANGDKMLLRIAAPAGPGGRGGGFGQPAAVPQYSIVSAAMPVKPGEGNQLRLADMEVDVDPAAEWKQMYHEVWRIQRSYFYDPSLHGVDAAKLEKEYQPYLAAVASRADLNYIFRDMLSEITSGHLRGGGGTLPQARTITGGLLGADFEISNGRYRIQRIFTGESWNPQLRAPLAQPGLKVAEGDYILSVNGKEVKGSDDLQRFLEGTSNKQVALRVSSDTNDANARDVIVTPTNSEAQLRHQAWVEGNRRKVDQLSGGKLAYVYMPDTAQGGLTSFNRYYFAQVEKQGVVLDERFNSGGQVADYVIEVLNRQLLAWWSPRYGAIYRSPAASILGPKVMVINEFAGSGGDAMPWMFRHTKTGTLVGKRTWGGLIGVGGYPTLMDGGTVTAPHFGFFSPSGEWEVENHGVAPDVEVDQDPKSVRDGHDPQLERAVAIALKELEKNPPPTPKRPKYPDYINPRPGIGGAATAPARVN